MVGSKVQTEKVRMRETESKDDLDARTGVAPLTGNAADVDKDIESGDAAARTPEPSWPLSALFAKKNWNTFRHLSIGTAVALDGPRRQPRRRRSRSPFGSYRTQSDPEGKKTRKSIADLQDSQLKVTVPDSNDESEGDKTRSRSPLQRFNLCRAAYYTSDESDWVTADDEINDRREFIVVLAASLQKFGAATHLTESFTDAVAKVR
jgi:hypothetical protein